MIKDKKFFFRAQRTDNAEWVEGRVGSSHTIENDIEKTTYFNEYIGDKYKDTNWSICTVITDSIISLEESEAIHELLDDLYNVGKIKSLGYLPLDTLTEMCNKSIQDMIDYANKNKLNWLIYDYEDCFIVGGAIYMYDETMLMNILQKYSEALISAAIPCDSCIAYINYIAKNTVLQSKYPEAYSVIGLTFSDERFI